MSKKTRKKSPKTASAKVTRAPATARAKKAVAKTPKVTAAKPAKAGKKKKPAKAAVAASHKAPSKALKSTAAKTTAPARSKTVAAKSTEAKPPAKKGSGEEVRSNGQPLAEGTKAPAFQLPRDGGGTVSLKDFAGRNLVLFFYPRADTPGCTKEAIDFTRLAGSFANCGTAVMGVSADPLKAQESFKDKYELTTPLASDEKHEMLHAYGVWGEKSMYGKTFHGILRTTVLIGPDGRVLRIWRNVKVDGHADEVLSTVQAL